MTFSDRELQTIAGALAIAAKVYDDDARVARNCAGGQRIVAQFDRQASECRALVDLIANNQEG